LAGKPAPPSEWKAVALNADPNIESQAADINDAGNVVGVLFTSNGWRAVLWHVTGKTVNQYLLADGTWAWGVNELQQVVGDSGGQAAYWESVSSPALVLPPMASPGFASARELNDQRVIVGSSRAAANDDFYPVAWRVVNGVVTDFLVLPGGEGEAADLTNNDTNGVATIVGQANFRPVTWTVRSEVDGSLTVLSGPDDVDPDAVGYGHAAGINALGDVCGDFWFTNTSEWYSAVRAWNGGSLEILEQINEKQLDDRNSAQSINNAGQAVGADNYTTSQGSTKATGVLWAVDGSAKQLINLVSGWRAIYRAAGINNDGVIAADGQLVANGKPHALIMIPPQ
jgi:hypothetical protein